MSLKFTYKRANSLGFIIIEYNRNHIFNEQERNFWTYGDLIHSVVILWWIDLVESYSLLFYGSDLWTKMRNSNQILNNFNMGSHKPI